MKKVTSLFLVLLMVLTTAITAFASEQTKVEKKMTFSDVFLLTEVFGGAIYVCYGSDGLVNDPTKRFVFSLDSAWNQPVTESETQDILTKISEKNGIASFNVTPIDDEFYGEIYYYRAFIQTTEGFLTEINWRGFLES